MESSTPPSSPTSLSWAKETRRSSTSSPRGRGNDRNNIHQTTKTSTTTTSTSSNSKSSNAVLICLCFGAMVIALIQFLLVSTSDDGGWHYHPTISLLRQHKREATNRHHHRAKKMTRSVQPVPATIEIQTANRVEVAGRATNKAMKTKNNNKLEQFDCSLFTAHDKKKKPPKQIDDPNMGKMYARETTTSPPFWISLHSKEYDPKPWNSIMATGKDTEHQLTHIFYEILSIASPNAAVVIDVGSNIGWYSLLSASIGIGQSQQRKVYSFDANPINLIRLCESIELNHWTSSSSSTSTTIGDDGIGINENSDKLRLKNPEHQQQLRQLRTAHSLSSKASSHHFTATALSPKAADHHYDISPTTSSSRASTTTIDLYNYGVSDTTTASDTQPTNPMALYVPKNEPGSASFIQPLNKRTTLEKDLDARIDNIGLITLDDFATQQGWLNTNQQLKTEANDVDRIAILNIDVEGYEANVVRGGRKLIGSGLIDNIIMEISFPLDKDEVSLDNLKEITSTLLDSSYHLHQWGYWKGPHMKLSAEHNHPSASILDHLIEKCYDHHQTCTLWWKQNDNSDILLRSNRQHRHDHHNHQNGHNHPDHRHHRDHDRVHHEHRHPKHNSRIHVA